MDPLAESPIPKDKWVTNEAFALSYPPMSDDVSRKSAFIPFEGRLQDRHDDPEVQGGRIALIETNNQLVQNPPNCLDRMTTTKQKQVAHNQRVLRAEDEIAGFNCDIADFLSEMNSTELVTTYVNAGASMKRRDAVIGGQFWQQGDRKMTAVNGGIEGMANTRESAILSAAAEAVGWRHAAEPGQRVIIYPAEVPQLEEAMNAFAQNQIPLEDGDDIALSKMLEGSRQFENSPRFFREDGEEIRSNPEFATSVPLWMNIAAQASTEGRQLVLENGSDVMNSSDEDSENE
jgi:hypothetical protein